MQKGGITMPSDEKKTKRTRKKAAPKEEIKPAVEASEKIDDTTEPEVVPEAEPDVVPEAEPAEEAEAVPEVVPAADESDAVATDTAEAEPAEEAEAVAPDAEPDVAPEDSDDSPALPSTTDEEAADAAEAEDVPEGDESDAVTDTVTHTEGESEHTEEGEHAPKFVPAPKKKKEGPRRIDAIFDFIELFVFTLAVVLFITAFFLRHSVVDGDSMLGTLHNGENLLISDFLYEPERGDIVVVDDHSTSLKKPIIKRVIALGGDTVRITRTGVYVNGELLEEEYVFTDNAGYVYDIYPSAALMTNDTLVVKAGEYYELTVPEGELFIMGDHRNKSTDSREIGTVDEDAVLGRVILRFSPMNKFGKVE